jgi:t-SNARE complex subunit (syntaxin)
MSRLNRYLTRKERRLQKEIDDFVEETDQLIKDVPPNRLKFEKEDTVEAAKRNLLRQEFNEKLAVYDGSINGTNSASRKTRDKVVILYGMLKMTIFIAIVTSLTVCAIFGGIILLIKTLW